MKKNSQKTQCYTIDFVYVPIEKKSFWREELDTLAQTGTYLKRKPPLELSGFGSDINDKSVLNARAKRKLVTHKVVLALIDVAKKKGDLEMEKTLWNTYYCLHNVVVSDNKLYGHYCGNRICTICTSIRKAKMINKYLPLLQSWEKPYMVTLTVKSCSAKNLNSRMRDMKRAFKRILTMCKKRHQRGETRLKMIGIKSLECNFNPNFRTYNPHFHVIVPNWEVAILLKREWMKLWTKRFTNGWAQDIRPIKNNEEGLIEVVKYGSKIFTEPDPNKKKVNRQVYVSALYNILISMKGLRLFDRFGFVKQTNETKRGNSTSKLMNYEKLSYFPAIMDWVNDETGESLSGYTPNLELQNLLNHRINTTLQ